jgi:ParB family chromosome partitioning protein
MAKDKGLGRGLEALLAVSNTLPAANSVLEDNQKNELVEVSIDKLTIGSLQPRKTFESEALEELAKSIKHNGIIQPLVVRKVKGQYELIAGERRLRASKIAGLKKVPVIVKKLSDKEAIAIALVENIQRKDLNIVEEAEGYQRLIEEFKLTHADLSSITGRSRSHITNILRLLNLDQEVLSFLLHSHISMGHARALLPLPANLQLSIAKEIIRDNLTTAQIEKRVARLLNGVIKPETFMNTSVDFSSWEQQLAEKIAMKVNIKPQQNGSGKLVITYDAVDKLNKFLNSLGITTSE